ncbi:Uncharacterised protein [Mycobacteroides abscessus subsp. abscessus]|nr:Uncharacterised protein [Mycobacteroides abscessus subsp. abscessus]
MGVPIQDGDLLIALGQRDVELHQKAIELGFGQLIRALVFDGILGGRNDERIGQGTRGAIDGDLLISSASSRLVNTGPARNSNAAVRAS